MVVNIDMKSLGDEVKLAPWEWKPSEQLNSFLALTQCPQAIELPQMHF